MSKGYEAPEIREIGTLQALTQQQFNKIGPTPDTQSSNPNIVGSLVPR